MAYVIQSKTHAMIADPKRAISDEEKREIFGTGWTPWTRNTRVARTFTTRYDAESWVYGLRDKTRVSIVEIPETAA